MKKITVTLLGVLACGGAYALPFGNPADPVLLTEGVFYAGDSCDPCDPCDSWFSALSVRIGYQGDFVYNRKMRLKSSSSTVTTTRIMTNAGVVYLNFGDRVDAYGLVGATNIKMGGDGDAFGASPGAKRFLLASSTDISWGVGARATFLKWGCTSLGVDGKYFRAQPGMSRDVQNDQATRHDTATFKYHEWQVGVGAAHRINKVVPYVGVVWASPRINLSNVSVDSFGATFGNYKEQHCFGYVVGATLLDCAMASVTGEVRFLSETAASVNAQVRF